MVASSPPEPRSPPKPRLTLRVGVAGHRRDKLDAEAVGRIEPRLKALFEAIDAATKQVLDANLDCYAKEDPAIRLVSGFAQGTDLIAIRLRPAGWQVEAILPFARDIYVETFEGEGAADDRAIFADLLNTAVAVTELAAAPPVTGHKHPHGADGETRGHGLADAASYFLRQVDVLVVAWDGQPPRTAGTGAMAKHAFENGIPVIWVSTKQDVVPRLIKGFDERGRPIAPQVDCIRGPLAAVLQSILGGPSTTTGEARISARGALQDFYKERWRQRCYLPLFDLLKRFASGQKLRYVIRLPSFADACQEWKGFLTDTPEADDLRGRVGNVLLPRYAWADSLAVYFSHCYRSTYVLAYTFSALAVFIALTGLFTHSHNKKAAIVLAELVVIGIIIAMIWYGRRLRWHERWLDYRALAERLRHGRFLAFVSEFGQAQKTSDDATGVELPWMLWYLRATMREIGLPTAVLDGTYQWRLLNATLTHEINGQVDYHEATSKSVHAIDHMLHRIGVICFVTTFAVLCLFLLGYVAELAMRPFQPLHDSAERLFGGSVDGFKTAMIFFSAGLPALGAAVYSIRIHGDFEGFKLRSIATAGALRSLQREYRTAMDREIDLEATADTLIRTARLMSEDLAAWQDLYGRKRLMLPA